MATLPPLTPARRVLLMHMLVMAGEDTVAKRPLDWDALVDLALQFGAGLREVPRPVAAEFAPLRGMSVGSAFADA